ncbi:MAG: aldose 1-epimerase family protein, partial [Bacteroidia bacterium]|nr:aldose 1-epimerase family protein [Bacteroidia bacterium]
MSTSYQISSENLKISVSEKGAELISVRDVLTNYEFIWQANPAVWGRYAPVLFPIVGKLNQNKITINHQVFEMSQHGFARDCSFEMIELYTDLLKFMLSSNENTLQHYPYHFKFFISYEVIKNALKIEYTILNEDSQRMYFSVGAHPGFNLPVHDLSKFAIQFEKEENLDRYLLHDGLQTKETENIGSNQSVLNLNSDLFEKDA